MRKEAFIETIKTIEKYVTIIGVIIIVLFNILNSFIHIPELYTWLNKNIPFIVITSSTFLIMFIHTMFEQLFSMQPKYNVTKLKGENKKEYNHLFSEAKNIILTTHIYALPFPDNITDLAIEHLKRKNNDQNRENDFIFKRIIGIVDKTDILFAKTNLELINKFKSVDIEIFVIDLTSTKKLNVFPNIVICDDEESLLSFPIRKENETRGLILKGKDAINYVLNKYWHKLKEEAEPISLDLIEKIELKIEKP